MSVVCGVSKPVCEHLLSTCMSLSVYVYLSQSVIVRQCHRFGETKQSTENIETEREGASLCEGRVRENKEKIPRIFKQKRYEKIWS